jgi:putative ABC transport system permease protein
MMASCAQLAWRYVTRHPRQTALLAAALALVIALPLCLRVLVKATESAMHERAVSTPLLLGARGSSLDLMLSTLYFKHQPLPAIDMRHVEDTRTLALGVAIPLDVRFQAQGTPIVGTALEYFSFRNLPISKGRMMTRLGDCVLGARVAAVRGLMPGDSIFSSQEQVFDMAGVYPLKMRVTGVLQANGSADDDAVFVDLKTTWLISGLAHGHENVSATQDAVLKKEGDNTVANASVRIFNEVTDQNLNSFHFHGDTGSYQISAAIIMPNDAKAEAILAGRYLKSSLPVQVIRPKEEFESLMGTLFRMQNLALMILSVSLAAALAITTLVFALSFRLRRREFRTLEDLGISPSDLVWTKALEIGMVGGAGLLLAVIITLVVQSQASSWIRLLLT